MEMFAVDTLFYDFLDSLPCIVKREPRYIGLLPLNQAPNAASYVTDLKQKSRIHLLHVITLIDVIAESARGKAT